MLNKHITEAIQRTVDDDHGNVAIFHAHPKGILDQLTSQLAGVSKVIRANGREELEIDNGSWVKIVRLCGYGRGLTPNLLVLPIGLSHDQRDELVPTVAAGGEILGYL